MRTTTTLALVLRSVVALNVTYRNCLDDSVRSPRFDPTLVFADFDSTSKTISYQIFGNMTGQVNDTNADNTLASAVTDTISVAGYSQTKVDKRLCTVSADPLLPGSAVQCPFGPGSVLLEYDVPLNSSFIFASITSEIRINGPMATNFGVGCLELTITPPFSRAIDSILTYIPLVILLLVGLKVFVVALANPWSGTVDPYRAFSNFGLDPSALRMSTPGFADCLIYLQFVVITSMLDVDYPGFFQLATSRISWSMLLFHESPISRPFNYTPSQSSSIATYINFVGARRQDAWKSFMIWWIILLACTAGVVAVIITTWWLLTPSSTDLTRKNMPFLGGCMLRIYYWLLLPLSAFTSYQLLTAQQSVAALTALAALVLMIVIVLCPISLVYYLVRYKSRQDLYDDLSLLSLFGPLYNTFSEHSMIYLVPNIVLQIFRGLTIGFLQGYGTAQIVLLAIFEAVNFASLMLLLPWPRSTNTNLMNLIFTGTRFLVVILMITFIPHLALSSGKREWVGYIILIVHAAVLIFGFLGNALLTLLELIIRLLVIVPQDEGARAIFGAKQLKSRREKRSPAGVATAMTTTTTTSVNSLSGLMDNKEESPFFRTPRIPSRLSSRLGAESSMGDVRSADGSDEALSPFAQDTAYYGGSGSKMSKGPIVRSQSLASEELLNAAGGRAGAITPSRLDSAQDMYDLSLEPTEDAVRRGVDYAVREADVYHPQSSGELLGPSKKLGTGPADPNGIKFRRLSWAPWRKEKNEERGKFVVVRSAPAPPKTTNVALRQLDTSNAILEHTTSPTSPCHETLDEESDGAREGEGDEHDIADQTGRHHHHLFSGENGIPRRIVSDPLPVLPRLNLFAPQMLAFDDSMATSPDEGRPFLTSPIDSRTGTFASLRRDSDSSDSSELAAPSRPPAGERVPSHLSERTERSVRSNLVRDSYVSSSVGITPGFAELVDFDLEKRQEE